MTVSRVVPECQFAHVVIVARRARQLMAGARPLCDTPRVRKPTRVAEEELERGLLEYDADLSVEPEPEEKRKR